MVVHRDQEPERERHRAPDRRGRAGASGRPRRPLPGRPGRAATRTWALAGWRMKFHDGTRRNATSNRGSASSRGPSDTMMPATSRGAKIQSIRRVPAGRCRASATTATTASTSATTPGYTVRPEAMLTRVKRSSGVGEKSSTSWSDRPGARHGAAEQESLQEEQEAAGRQAAGDGERHRDRPGAADDHHRRHRARSHAPWTRSGRARAAATSRRPVRSRPRPRGATAGRPRGSGARPRVASVTRPAASSQAASSLPDREREERDHRADREAHGQRILPALARERAERPVGERDGDGAAPPASRRAPTARSSRRHAGRPMRASA